MIVKKKGGKLLFSSEWGSKLPFICPNEVLENTFLNELEIFVIYLVTPVNLSLDQLHRVKTISTS